MTSTTPYETLPEELDRQSKRILEQVKALEKILTTVSGNLTSMSTMMEKYSPDLVAQFKRLNDAIVDYQTKSNKVGTAMSETLGEYARNLTNNLAGLTDAVGRVEDSVKALNV